MSSTFTEEGGTPTPTGPDPGYALRPSRPSPTQPSFARDSRGLKRAVRIVELAITYAVLLGGLAWVAWLAFDSVTRDPTPALVIGLVVGGWVLVIYVPRLHAWAWSDQPPRSPGPGRAGRLDVPDGPPPPVIPPYPGERP